MLTPTSEKFKKFANYIRSWEGGKSSDPNDSASKYVQPGQIHTNRGVIWPTFKSNAKKLGIAPTYENFLNLTADQADQIVFQFYLLCGGNFFNDEIALTLTEFTWGSGLGYTQRALRKAIRSFGYPSIEATGSINQVVISVTNQINSKELYAKLWANRKLFLESISKSRPANQKFLKGWLNRWESFQKTFPATGVIAGGFFFYCNNWIFNL
jgi:lysozyme family protein